MPCLTLTIDDLSAQTDAEQIIGGESQRDRDFQKAILPKLRAKEE